MSAVSLKTNLASMQAIRRLGESSRELSSTFERLSSGQRINRASDDAAGLAVASSLDAEARVYGQAYRNINDGISYLNIAEGGASQLKTMLFRLRELATQASNGSFSNAQRQSLDVETQALQAEYNRVIDSTSFNGAAVLQGSNLVLQAGFGTDARLVVTLAGSPPVTSTPDGTFQARRSFAAGNTPFAVSVADFNDDGKADLVSADYNSDTLSVLLGNGDGTFQGRRTFASSSNPRSLSVADFNGDGKVDVVAVAFTATALSIFLGNGDGTLLASQTYAASSNARGISVADFNGDGKSDILAADSGNTLSVLLGNGNGTFQARRSFAAGNTPFAVSVADFNDDGKADLVSADQASNTLSVLLGNGDGTFQARRSFASGADPRAISAADFNGDGKTDLVSADYNSNTLSVLLGNGNGTFQARQTVSTGSNPFWLSVADFNGDGTSDLVSADSGASSLSVLLGNSSIATVTQGLQRMSGVSVSIQSAALTAQGQIDSYLANVNSVTGTIGASLSRFETAARMVATTSDVFKAAEGRIRDADIALETAKLTRNSILQQAASAVLAQANQQPSLTLLLLGA